MATTDAAGSMKELTLAFSTDLVDLKAGGEAGLAERGIQARVAVTMRKAGARDPAT